MLQKKIDFTQKTTMIWIIGILIAINVISWNFFTRFDLTDGDIYTLSDVSKRIVGELDDKVIVKAYFTEDLPAPYNNTARYLKDELDEYKAYSNGNLEYQFIDAGEDQAQKEEILKLGIPELQAQIVENEKLEIKKVMMGLAFFYEDKKEIIPVVKNAEGLEYEITSIIKRITSRNRKVIGFLKGHNEPDLYKNLKPVYDELDRQYVVTTVDVSDGSMVGDDIDVLMAVGSKGKIAEWDQFAIDQFIMRNGKAAFFIENVNVNLQLGVGIPSENGFNPLLRNYGVFLNDDLVIDVQHGRITVQQEQGGFVFNSMINFPFLPIVTNFNKDHIITQDISSVGFNFVSSIDTSLLAAQRDVEFSVLATSSDKSGSRTKFNAFNPLAGGNPFAGNAQGQFISLDPSQKWTKEMFDRSYLPLAVALKGSFNSYFAPKEIPLVQIGEGDTARVQPGDLPTNYQRLNQSTDSRIVLVGDGSLVSRNSLQNEQNFSLFMNIVDWLAQDEDMITIRSKSITTSVLEETEDGTKKLLKWGNILGPPLIILVIGLARWRGRQKSKKSIL